MVLVRFGWEDWAAVGASGSVGVVGAAPARPVLDHPIVTTKPVQIRLDGQGAGSRVFDPTPVGQGVTFTVSMRGFPPGPYTVAIPDVPAVTFSTLLHDFQLDAATLTPSPSGQAAWDAVLAQVQAARDQSVSASSSAVTAGDAAVAAAGAAADAGVAAGAARDAAAVAASQAAGYASSAVSAKAAAESARDAAQLVPTTSDALMTSVAQNPASAFAGQLSATIAHSGQFPVITLDTDDSAWVPVKDYAIGVYSTTMPGSGAAQSGTMRVKVHGNSTAAVPKKPWKLKLDVSAKLAGATNKAKSWVLLAGYFDPAKINNQFAMHYGKLQFGPEFVPEYVPVEVVLNGSYLGLYAVIDDKKAIEVGRVPGIDPSKAPDNPGSDVTILYEGDNKEFGQDGFTGFKTTRGQAFALDGPNATQATYAQTWMQAFEDALYSSAFRAPDAAWRGLVDQQSVIDEWLIEELTYNTDSANTSGFYSSYYLWKAADAPAGDGLLHGGPLWDFDLSLGVGWGFANPPTGWKTRQAPWIGRLHKDPAFATFAATRWAVLKTNLTGYEAWIDARLGELARGIHDDDALWGAGRASGGGTALTFTALYSERIKRWIATRIAWLDARLSNPACLGVQNLIPNARMASTTPDPADASKLRVSGWTVGWGSSSDTQGGTPGAWNMTSLQAGGHTYVAGLVVPLLAGTYTFIVTVETSVARAFRLVPMWGSLNLFGPFVSVPANTPTELRTTFTLTADANIANMYLGTETGAAAGDVYTVSKMCLVPVADTAHPYTGPAFNGDTPGTVWDGLPDQSAAYFPAI